MKLSKTAVAAAAALALAACGDQGPVEAGRTETAPLLTAAPGRGIQGEYIVVLKAGSNPASIAAAAGATPKHVYSAALTGFAARLNPGQVAALQHNPRVAFIEQDQTMGATATQSGAPWGLDRIDQVNLPLSGTYTYNTTASSVYAYVIDTGIYTSHSNFGGRASNVYDALGGNGQDCNGHGTHVAGTIGGSTYGVAKAVKLRGLRVLNCSGSGSTSGIIAAVNWLVTNHTDPAVANLSLGGGVSSSLNSAVTSLANAGVFVAVAAGNESQNACNTSPASATAVTSVGASQSNDVVASYSNYGSCVDIYAPGTNILSTWYNGGTATISGTSMASPHVAGVAALYKATNGNASQSTIDTWLKNNASVGVLSGVPSGSPNRLLNKRSL